MSAACPEQMTYSFTSLARLVGALLATVIILDRIIRVRSFTQLLPHFLDTFNEEITLLFIIHRTFIILLSTHSNQTLCYLECT